MIPRKTIARCGRSIVASMNLKRSDCVIIGGGTHAQQLLEDIAYECYKVGALPSIRSSSDDFTSRVMKGIPSSTLEQVPRHSVGATEAADCLINTESIEDPSIMGAFPRSKIEARTRANVPIRRIVLGEGPGGGKKWCYAGWPTRKAASFYGVGYELYEKFIIEGMTVPIPALRRRCEGIANRLEAATHVHVSDDEGTDFEMKIEGRRRNLDDGFVSDEDVAVRDKGNNLPAGEVFVAPRESWGSGKIFCPVTKDKFSGKIVKNVELEFSKGKLHLDQVKAEENLEALVKSFKGALRVDEQTQKRIRTLNLAEFGIGCNPKISRAIGYILTDEKIIGSTHIAFGSNYSYGGTSKSAMHWDFVTVPKATVIARTADGEERTVLRNGKISRGTG